MLSLKAQKGPLSLTGPIMMGFCGERDSLYDTTTYVTIRSDIETVSTFGAHSGGQGGWAQ